ncbi:MAG: Bacterial regulatory protein gntR family [Bacteroidota bacterium]
MRKQTSKRDQAVCAIKQYILDNPLQPGETLPSAREIAKAIQTPLRKQERDEITSVLLKQGFADLTSEKLKTALTQI